MLGPLLEKVFMHRDFRDRWQEIWFDPFVESAVHEMMCSRNSYCSLNRVQLPAALLRCQLHGSFLTFLSPLVIGQWGRWTSELSQCCCSYVEFFTFLFVWGFSPLELGQVLLHGFGFCFLFLLKSKAKLEFISTVPSYTLY